MKKLLLAALIGAAFATPVAAQTLQVSTGGPKGTYHQMLLEMRAICTDGIQLVPMESSGSVENLARLVGNKVNGAFTQTDVLWVKSRTENLNNVKTLLALHPEEVHIIARSEERATGFFDRAKALIGRGENTGPIHDASQLAGRTVAAAGGSFVTADAFRLQSEIRYNIVEAQSNDRAMEMLRDGRADAVMAVGGAPLAWVEALGREYRLVPVLEVQRERLKTIYNPATLSYTGMGAAGVPTVSVDALLVTREYKTKRFMEQLAVLRACVYANIDEFRETIGYHPKWQLVDVNNRGKMPWYDLPEVGTAAKK